LKYSPIYLMAILTMIAILPTFLDVKNNANMGLKTDGLKAAA
jgi:hypothetical protein